MGGYGFEKLNYGYKIGVWLRCLYHETVKKTHVVFGVGFGCLCVLVFFVESIVQTKKFRVLVWCFFLRVFCTMGKTVFWRLLRVAFCRCGLIIIVQLLLGFVQWRRSPADFWVLECRFRCVVNVCELFFGLATVGFCV